MPIPLFGTPKLYRILAANKVKSWRAAYEGESVGIDLYNVGKSFVLPPINPGTSVKKRAIKESAEGRKILIPTGLHIALPRGMVGILKERGSISKTPLILRAGVIDPGYTGQIFVNLVNVSSTPYTIERGQKLPVQLIVTPAITTFTEVDFEEYTQLTEASLRKAGKVGSSD